MAAAKISEYFDEFNGPGKVNILTDSQATLHALNRSEIKSQTVKECILNLNTLGEHTDICISWIKAHNNYLGNELADEKAKEGAHSDDIPVMNRSAKSEIRNTIDLHYSELWNKRWTSHKECRQTKIWFPNPDQNKFKKLIKLNRETFSTMVRWVTGHNFLKRHNAIIEPEPHDPNCRYFGLEPETSSHLITQCEVLCHYRAEIFNTHFLSITNPEWRGEQPVYSPF